MGSAHGRGVRSEAMDGSETLARSGIAPIDERLGGVFLGEALTQGGSAAILTEDDPQDLIAQATDLGIDLRRAATTGRFVLTRYQRDFATRFSRTLSPAS